MPDSAHYIQYNQPQAVVDAVTRAATADTAWRYIEDSALTHFKVLNR